jgi:uridine phosphorylase
MSDKNVKATAPTVDGKVYHLRLAKGDIPPYMLMPGDQATTEHISSVWQDTKKIAQNREYHTVTGSYLGDEMGIISTGIGDQPAEICINELKKVGAHTLIKLGCAEAICEDIQPGEIIIPVACMRKGGAVTHYVNQSFPAFAHPRITKALIEACVKLGYSYRLGVVCSISSYYIGQGRPLNADENSYFPPHARDIVARLQNSKVIAIDNETAGSLIIGYLHRLRMGAVLWVNANRVTGAWGECGGEEKACRVASEAVRILRVTDTDASLYI